MGIILNRSGIFAQSQSRHPPSHPKMLHNYKGKISNFTVVNPGWCHCSQRIKVNITKQSKMYFFSYPQSLFFFFFFFCHSCGVWKFLGQGSNLYHSSHLSHSRDDIGSLTLCTTREFPQCVFARESYISNKMSFCFDLVHNSKYLFIATYSISIAL